VSQVEIFVMKYCNEMVTHKFRGKTLRMDPAALMPVFQEKKDTLDKMTGKMEEMFTAEGRQAAREQKELARAPKGQEGDSMAATMTQTMKRAGNMFRPDLTKAVTAPGEAIDSMEKKMASLTLMRKGAPAPPPAQDPVQWLPPKDARVADLLLPQLCVRLKNLRWGQQQVKSLEDDVHTLWRKELDRRPAARPDAPADPAVAGVSPASAEGDKEGADESLGEILVNSQMVLHHGQQQLIEYIGIKIVFFDLREDFVARLYYPSPSACPLSTLLEEGSALDQSLAQVSEEVMSCESLEGSSDLMWAVLERVCEAVVQALEWCLVGEPMGHIDRRMVPEDAQTVVEDLMALKRYFVQRDEAGTVHGLDEERVAGKTARLEMLANNLLSLSTERLVELYYDRTTPEHSDRALIDRQTIVGALVHRPEKAALDLVKDVRKRKH
jgi:hypothetical protein